jgi:hypothetical protein
LINVDSAERASILRQSSALASSGDQFKLENKMCPKRATFCYKMTILVHYDLISSVWHSSRHFEEEALSPSF